MKTIRTLIIDDEAPARSRLRNLLKPDQRCAIVGEAENGVTAIDLIRKTKPDLLLLDIELKDMTGFDVLKKVGNHFEGTIIFITAYDEFAISAFEANAIDYLLKPFKATRFEESIERAIQNINKNHQPSLDDLVKLLDQKVGHQNFIRIPEGKVIHHLDPEHLIYVQSEGYYCNFYSGEKPKVIRISLTQTDEVLPSHFLRINRSIIINRNKISATRKFKKSVSVKMISGEEFSAVLHQDQLA